jgi:hypothetical protein
MWMRGSSNLVQLLDMVLVERDVLPRAEHQPKEKLMGAARLYRGALLWCITATTMISVSLARHTTLKGKPFTSRLRLPLGEGAPPIGLKTAFFTALSTACKNLMPNPSRTFE